MLHEMDLRSTPRRSRLTEGQFGDSLSSFFEFAALGLGKTDDGGGGFDIHRGSRVLFGSSRISKYIPSNQNIASAAEALIGMDQVPRLANNDAYVFTVEGDDATSGLRVARTYFTFSVKENLQKLGALNKIYTLLKIVASSSIVASSIFDLCNLRVANFEEKLANVLKRELLSILGNYLGKDNEWMECVKNILVYTVEVDAAGVSSNVFSGDYFRGKRCMFYLKFSIPIPAQLGGGFLTLGDTFIVRPYLPAALSKEVGHVLLEKTQGKRLFNITTGIDYHRMWEVHRVDELKLMDAEDFTEVEDMGFRELMHETNILYGSLFFYGNDEYFLGGNRFSSKDVGLKIYKEGFHIKTKVIGSVFVPVEQVEDVKMFFSDDSRFCILQVCVKHAGKQSEESNALDAWIEYFQSMESVEEFVQSGKRHVKETFTIPLSFRARSDTSIQILNACKKMDIPFMTVQEKSGESSQANFQSVTGKPFEQLKVLETKETYLKEMEVKVALEFLVADHLGIDLGASIYDDERKQKEQMEHEALKLQQAEEREKKKASLPAYQQQVFKSFEEELRWIYFHCASDKLTNQEFIPHLLEKYKGKESLLFKKLRKKYGHILYKKETTEVAEEKSTEIVEENILKLDAVGVWVVMGPPTSGKNELAQALIEVTSDEIEWMLVDARPFAGTKGSDLHDHKVNTDPFGHAATLERDGDWEHSEELLLKLLKNALEQRITQQSVLYAKQTAAKQQPQQTYNVKRPCVMLVLPGFQDAKPVMHALSHHTLKGAYELSRVITTMDVKQIYEDTSSSSFRYKFKPGVQELLRPGWVDAICLTATTSELAQIRNNKKSSWGSQVDALKRQIDLTFDSTSSFFSGLKSFELPRPKVFTFKTTPTTSIHSMTISNNDAKQILGFKEDFKHTKNSFMHPFKRIVRAASDPKYLDCERHASSFESRQVNSSYAQVIYLYYIH